MNGSDQFLGLVTSGKFQQLMPEPGPPGAKRFTTIQPQAAQAPESAELDLSRYEGSAIMVTGHDDERWVYSAEVIDHAGPILTAVVQKLLGPADKVG